MENNIVDIVFNNYGLVIKKSQVLSGGWMNRKYLVENEYGNRYVVKVFSSAKVEKMSNGEFSTDYLDKHTTNNLRIENYMRGNGLNCERVLLTSNNELMVSYGNDRIAIMEFLNGRYVSREEITETQLHNLGRECAKMHMLFKETDSKIYSGEYLKIPSLGTLFSRYNNKVSSILDKKNEFYIDTLSKQKQNLLLLKSSGIIDNIPVCITHGDFADDNILFYKDEPRILDFELVRQNSYLLDIGRIIMSYCYIEGTLDYERIRSFFEGYNTIRELNEKDILLSLITVWINEVDMWIKEKYFNRELTTKAKRFQDELIYLTTNLQEMIDNYYCAEHQLKTYCFRSENKKRRLKNESS